jgi:ATP-binding cassette subfamily B protein
MNSASAQERPDCCTISPARTEQVALPAVPSMSPSRPDRPATATARPLAALRPFVVPYRPQLLLAAIFLLLAAVSTLLLPFAMGTLVDRGLIAADPGDRIMALREHFLALFAVGAAIGVFSAARYYMVSWLGERITADLRSAVYAHVIRQSPAFFETTRGGEVLSRLTTDTTLVQTVVGSSLSMGLRHLVTGLGALTVLVLTHPGVMLPVLGVLTLVVLPTLLVGRRVRRLSRASQDRVADTSAIAAEVIAAIPVVQACGQEAREARRYHDAAEAAFETAGRRSRLRALMMAFMMTTTFGAVLWGLHQGTGAVLRGELSAGHLGQTVVYVALLVGSVAVLSEVWGDLLRAAGATERLTELLAERSPVQDPPVPRQLPPASGGAALDLRGVVFHYPSRPDRAALAGIDLQIHPGETIALVGPSGAGKSTLLQLLLRFHDVDAGAVEIDGVDVRALALADLRARIGLVPQDSTIFSADAMENIRYGRPDASDEAVFAAARAAQADGFIRALPEGYRTFLGERGVRLSGGQRQRISIARAILADAPLLLLDEATSALDAESERLVQAALDAAMKNRTTLVIAHRLATVQRADRIIVLDNGMIAEQGRHAELVLRGGLYARLAAMQFQSSATT